MKPHISANPLGNLNKDITNVDIVLCRAYNYPEKSTFASHLLKEHHPFNPKYFEIKKIVITMKYKFMGRIRNLQKNIIQIIF